MRDVLDALVRRESLIQIAILALVFYLILNFVRGTRGANILKGIVFLFFVAFLGVMYVADLLKFDEIKGMLEWALKLVPLALIIIFWPELRRGLSRLAQSPLISPLLRVQSRKVVDELVQAAARLSKNRIGALIVVERDVRLGDAVESGAPVDAVLTSELLETIFYPGTPLHDGGVILQGDRIAAAGCFFQLTDDPSVSTTMGTRHRAAIGVTEESDAVAIVVSEETGRISVVVHGKLTPDLGREALEKLLNELLSERSRGPDAAPWKKKPVEGPAPGPVEAPSPGQVEGSAPSPVEGPAPSKVEGPAPSKVEGHDSTPIKTTKTGGPGPVNGDEKRPTTPKKTGERKP